MAFGTGLHPTTQMCLAAIEKYARPGDAHARSRYRVGHPGDCSGAVGVKSIVGIDNDPLAVKVAAENAALNHVTEPITVERGSLAEANAAALAGRRRASI